MHAFLSSQEAWWGGRSGRLEVEPPRVAHPARRASPAPGHVRDPGSLSILRRKPAVSGGIVSHASQSSPGRASRHLRQSWWCPLRGASLCHQEEGGCSPNVFGFCDWAVPAQTGARAVQWLWGWAAVAGLPLGLFVRGRPLLGRWPVGSPSHSLAQGHLKHNVFHPPSARPTAAGHICP